MWSKRRASLCAFPTLSRVAPCARERAPRRDGGLFGVVGAVTSPLPTDAFEDSRDSCREAPPGPDGFVPVGAKKALISIGDHQNPLPHCGRGQGEGLGKRRRIRKSKSFSRAIFVRPSFC
jgi:hypothetical protein